MIGVSELNEVQNPMSAKDKSRNGVAKAANAETNVFSTTGLVVRQ